MSPTNRGLMAATALAAGLVASQLIPVTAVADPEQLPPPAQELHNVTYRARADGTSRGAVLAYKIDDKNVNSDQPTMLPGQTFQVNTVLADPQLAGMELSIQWPYGSNLHCEILVDEAVVAQADQFIAPRLTPQRDDPGYGMLSCGAPLDGGRSPVIPRDGSVPGATADTTHGDGTVPPPT
jgi:hypothetical protein